MPLNLNNGGYTPHIRYMGTPAQERPDLFRRAELQA